MPTPVIGISKRNFKIDNDNTFRVYGENFDDTAVTLKAKLVSSSFTWDPEEYTVAASDRKKHYVVLKSKPKHPTAPAPAKAASQKQSAASVTSGTDDDLTITLTFDDGGPDEAVVAEDYVVTFEDP